jgi:PAS domain S-box-containing protein
MTEEKYISKTRYTARRLWLPILTAALMIGVTIMIYQTLHDQEEQQVRAKVNQIAADFASVLENDIRARQQVIERMSQRWEVRGGTPKVEWQADAESYVALGGYRMIQWIDPTGRVQWIAPAQGHPMEAGSLANEDPGHRRALNESRKNKAPVFAPLAVRDGRFFLTTYVATHTRDTFWGWMAGVHELDHWLETIPTPQGDLSIRDHEGTVFEQTGDQSVATMIASAPLTVSSTPLTLRYRPTKAFVSAGYSAFPLAILLTGLIISVLTGWALFLALKGRWQYQILKAETAARVKAEAQARTLLAQLPMDVVFKDTEFNYALCNDSFARSRNIFANDVRGKSDFDFMPREQARAFNQLDRTVMQSGDSHQRETTLKIDGAERIVQMLRTRVAGDDGQVLGILEIHHDVTDQREREHLEREIDQRITRAQKLEAIGEMVGWVAHDLNNILAPAKGYPELIMSELPSDSSLYQDLNEIKQSADRAESILTDLLMLNPKAAHTRDAVKLDDAITRFFESSGYCALLASYGDVKINYSPMASGGSIDATDTRVQQLLLNLLSNAFAATKGQGVINITSRIVSLAHSVKGFDAIEAGSYITLRVQDSGERISPEHIERMFEPFYLRTTFARAGTGLGLAVVYGITKDLHGYIDVESDESGTDITLYFPITEKVAKPRPEDIQDITGREHILVVDDVLQQRQIAARMLSSLGYEVTTKPSGEQAIEFLRHATVDLVILDMHMEGGIDGLETYQRMRQIDSEQACIISSGFPETERSHKALALGAIGTMKKPFSLEMLGRTTRMTLDRDVASV